MLRKNNSTKNFTSGNETATTIVACLTRIFKKINESGLSEEASSELETDIRAVSERFGISPKAAILLAAVTEHTNTCNSCDEEDLALYLGCLNIEFIQFNGAVRELEDNGIICRCRGRKPCFITTVEAMKAIEKDSEFVPAKISGLSSDELFSRIRRLMCDFRSGIIGTDRLIEDLKVLVEKNGHLLFCRKVTESDLWTSECTDTERRMFFYLCHRYVSNGCKSVPVETLLNFTEFIEDENCIKRYIANGKSGLQTTGLASFSNENGYVDPDSLSLSDKVKDTFFQEVEIAAETQINHKDIIRCDSIKEQKLFYNEREADAVRRLGELLQEDNLKAVQARLESQGMPKGFSCLFAGGPGTGKTASLKALAKQSGRDLFWVDLSAIKSKWVGESEANMKKLFDQYRALARTSPKAPILAVNECDAIFCKRISDPDSSTDQMNNAITDIVLNELENLDGILIATTNLVGSMMDDKDSAMERRFLYKVEFSAPDESVRKKIWQSKLPHLTDDEAGTLSSEYGFSGGNIDNVARKSVVDYVLSGSHADLTTLRRYCDEETSVRAGKDRRRIGFE